MKTTHDAAPAVLSERLCEHLRNRDFESFAGEAPCAAMLLPLLDALGWRHDPRRLIEALPHFQDTFDAVELRAVMSALGFASSATGTPPGAINPDLMPCIFIAERGKTILGVAGTDGAVAWFDGVRWYDDFSRWQGLRGATYVFTNARANNPVQETANRLPWFERQMRRFWPLVGNLVVVTLMLNVVAVLTPLFVMLVYDKIIGTKTLDALPYFVGGIGFALACELALRQLRARTLGLVAARLDYAIGTATFERLLQLAPIMTERSSITAQLSKLKQFDAIRDFMTGSNATTMLELPFVLLSLALIAVLGGAIIVIPVAMIVVYLLFALAWAPRVKRQLAESNASRAARQQFMMETVSGMSEFKALGMERDWETRFRELSSSAMVAWYKVGVSQAVVQTVAQTVMMLAGVGVLAAGAYAVMAGTMTVGALIAVMALVWRVLGPLQGAFLSCMRMGQIAGGVRQINQMMKLDVENLDSNSHLLLPRMVGAVRFDRISYRYGPDKNPALMGVSFNISPGEFVVVIGENGSGKSTLLKLIAGMYQAQAGAISIDGIDSRQFNPVDLRRAIAYVPQKPTLFHGTIAQNLRLKDPLATEADIECALAAAGILDAVNALPNGIATRIGDARTGQLPTALIQGLCLARAFLGDSPILLLDEPGSSLDLTADQNLMRQLERIRGRKTIIMTSHRPSHIRRADKVMYIHNGSLVHVGGADACLEIMHKQAGRGAASGDRAPLPATVVA
ncbi:MAG: peptidase domain-containing ABC transporter [Gammaproteobacteria bacterium]